MWTLIAAITIGLGIFFGCIAWAVKYYRRGR